jgi:hypothetical protein
MYNWGEPQALTKHLLFWSMRGQSKAGPFVFLSVLLVVGDFLFSVQFGCWRSTVRSQLKGLN